MNQETEPLLPLPFNSVFTKEDKKNRVILIPNLSRSFSEMSAAVFRWLGYKAVCLPIADEEAQQLGKRYVHNDICFPAQINIGEFLRYLGTDEADPKKVAVAVAKNCRDCRAGQYSTLTRKALDDAGYPDVPIVTTGQDTKGIHPGFVSDVKFQLKMLWGIVIMDALDAMVRKTRPYEQEEGSVDRLYEVELKNIVSAFEKNTKKGLAALSNAIDVFNQVPVLKEKDKPKVFVIGEILLNYHDTSNRQLVRYLEKHGMEVILPDMVSFFWRQVVTDIDASKRRLVKHPILTRINADIYNFLYKRAVNKVDALYEKFRYYTKRPDVFTLASHVDGLVDRTIISGEGWLIPAEIIHYAQKDVSAFVIIQPFGCLPNQITGRGIVKSLKERFPHISVLALDYDYDVSMANLENRLQMLVMASRGYQL
jgi:predicted nucleotide-binding protein (sugar kinase/HSP70/actin superfamily)